MDENFQPLINNINKGKVANVAIEFMQTQLDSLIDSVDSAMFSKMDSGKKITYEELAMAFAEKHAYKKLIRAMKQTSRKGVSAGEKYAKQIKEKENGRVRANKTVSGYRTV